MFFNHHFLYPQVTKSCEWKLFANWYQYLLAQNILVLQYYVTYRRTINGKLSISMYTVALVGYSLNNVNVGKSFPTIPDLSTVAYCIWKCLEPRRKSVSSRHVFALPGRRWVPWSRENGGATKWKQYSRRQIGTTVLAFFRTQMLCEL